MEDEVNVTMRDRKRKRGDYEIKDLNSEMFSMFNEFKKDFFTSMRSSMDEIKAQNKQLQESFEYINNKYDDVLTELKEMQNDRRENRKYITQLEERIDYLESKFRSSNVEIRNIPKSESETKMDLVNMVVKLGQVLDTSVNQSDIKDVFRINNKSTKKPIIVEFTSTLIKEAIEKNVKNFNKYHSTDKLNTKHLHLEGPKIPVYVEENLTTKNKRLFYLAREFATQKNFRYCWTSNGRIFLRKEEGGQVIRINSEADIAAINTQK
ncbi:uncharacterized protein LOC113235388 [Hyposmocoma kahamanoa]|uniref:uncharacterized protein LOC113235388 n=1 Tax=Hyposmocoma kahamanoa TaxID=1477025 RepID=UPI000E6D63B1|nr:uncharacterized protein LOC113235388 [Hyposmocoma kahamanoa]